MRKLSLSFLVLVSICLSTSNLTAYELKVGEPFPTLTLPSLQISAALSAIARVGLLGVPSGRKEQPNATAKSALSGI